jgi:chemotaxis family two-component system sensor kinase Cph1
MRASKRVSTGLLAGTGTVLAGAVLFDVYEDWLVQGEPLWTSLFENSLPLLLVGVLPWAAWRLYSSDRSAAYTTSVTKGTLLGAGTMLLIASWVVGIQLFQGQLKPKMIVVQTTTVGAVAGLVAGYNTAEVEQARETTKRQKHRFESLFANSPSAIVDLAFEDSDGRDSATSPTGPGDDPVIERTNATFDDLFDYVDTDPSGRPLFEVIPPESRETREEMRAHVERGDVYTTETTQFTTEGGKDFTLRLVPYGDRRAYAIYQDITELKRSQRELERTVDQLERSNEQLQQFAYVASHDLQEPLRMVKSYVDLLETEYGDDLDEEADEYMTFAVDGAERMQRMIDDLLQYSRVETQASEFEEVDASDVLETTLKDLELRIAEVDATVTHDDLPTVRADPNQLGQLFQNLIKNAIDHAGDEPPEIHVSAEQDETDREVDFSVADDGPGIPEDQQERIFEIFEQGGRDDDGTGIGLAVCQRIVNRHGGDIWVESTDREGSTFHFTMPAASTQQAETSEPQIQ